MGRRKKEEIKVDEEEDLNEDALAVTPSKATVGAPSKTAYASRSSKAVRKWNPVPKDSSSSDEDPEICPICNDKNDPSPDNKKNRMIGCDSCDKWYHWSCVGINHDNKPGKDEDWYCRKCTAQRDEAGEWKPTKKEASKLDVLPVRDSPRAAASPSLQGTPGKPKSVKKKGPLTPRTPRGGARGGFRGGFKSDSKKALFNNGSPGPRTKAPTVNIQRMSGKLFAGMHVPIIDLDLTEIDLTEDSTFTAKPVTESPSKPTASPAKVSALAGPVTVKPIVAAAASPAAPTLSTAPRADNRPLTMNRVGPKNGPGSSLAMAGSGLSMSVATTGPSFSGGLSISKVSAEPGVPPAKDSSSSKDSESMGPLVVSIAKAKKNESWSVKPKKVKCTGCSKSFKDDSVLQHHSIYCTKIKQNKTKKPPSPLKAGLELGSISLELDDDSYDSPSPEPDTDVDLANVKAEKPMRPSLPKPLPSSHFNVGREQGDAPKPSPSIDSKVDTNSKGESVKPISPSISQDGGETREENEDSIIDKSKNTISDQGRNNESSRRTRDTSTQQVRIQQALNYGEDSDEEVFNKRVSRGRSTSEKGKQSPTRQPSPSTHRSPRPTSVSSSINQPDSTCADSSDATALDSLDSSMDINNGAESGDSIGGQAKKRKRSGSREPEKKKRSSPEKDDEPLFNILENVSISKISEDPSSQSVSQAQIPRATGSGHESPRPSSTGSAALTDMETNDEGFPWRPDAASRDASPLHLLNDDDLLEQIETDINGAVKPTMAVGSFHQNNINEKTNSSANFSPLPRNASIANSSAPSTEVSEGLQRRPALTLRTIEKLHNQPTTLQSLKNSLGGERIDLRLNLTEEMKQKLPMDIMMQKEVERPRSESQTQNYVLKHPLPEVSSQSAVLTPPGSKLGHSSPPHLLPRPGSNGEMVPPPGSAHHNLPPFVDKPALTQGGSENAYKTVSIMNRPAITGLPGIRIANQSSLNAKFSSPPPNQNEQQAMPQQKIQQRPSEGFSNKVEVARRPEGIQPLRQFQIPRANGSPGKLFIRLPTAAGSSATPTRFALKSPTAAAAGQRIAAVATSSLPISPASPPTTTSSGYLFPLSARLNPVVSPPPPAVSPAGGQQPDLSLANNSALSHTSPAVNPTITTTSLHHVIHSSGNTRPQFQSNPMLASNVINRAFVGSSHVISPGSLMSTSVQSRPDNNHTMSQNNSAVSQHQTNPVAVSQHQTNPVAVSQHQTNGGNQQNQLFSGQVVGSTLAGNPGPALGPLHTVTVQLPPGSTQGPTPVLSVRSDLLGTSTQSSPVNHSAASVGSGGHQVPVAVAQPGAGSGIQPGGAGSPIHPGAPIRVRGGGLLRMRGRGLRIRGGPRPRGMPGSPRMPGGPRMRPPGDPRLRGVRPGGPRPGFRGRPGGPQPQPGARLGGPAPGVVRPGGIRPPPPGARTQPSSQVRGPAPVRGPATGHHQQQHLPQGAQQSAPPPRPVVHQPVIKLEDDDDIIEVVAEVPAAPANPLLNKLKKCGISVSRQAPPKVPKGLKLPPGISLSAAGSEMSVPRRPDPEPPAPTKTVQLQLSEEQITKLKQLGML